MNSHTRFKKNYTCHRYKKLSFKFYDNIDKRIRINILKYNIVNINQFYMVHYVIYIIVQENTTDNMTRRVLSVIIMYCFLYTRINGYKLELVHNIIQQKKGMINNRLN